MITYTMSGTAGAQTQYGTRFLVAIPYGKDVGGTLSDLDLDLINPSAAGSGRFELSQFKNFDKRPHIQHHTPSPDMEPAGEKEERLASQQLEPGH
nr:hypothetical protein BaRGS_016000 [Batillaria attramentaria]